MIDVFADLNCPFCFSLHERLISLGLIEQVHWRSIEHAPGIDSRNNDPRQINQLNTHCKLLLQRAPDVAVCNPGFIPGTALANNLLLSVEERYPEKLVEVRTALYRAYWQNQQDISDPVVLYGLLREYNIGIVEPGDAQTAQLERWQYQWQFGDYDQRIPVMQRESGEAMVGLQCSATLQRFVELGNADSDKRADANQYIHKEKVAVFCDSDQQSLLLHLAEREPNIELLFYPSAWGLRESLRSESVDLVLIQQDIEDGLALCKDIREDSYYLDDLPIVMFCHEEDVLLECQALYHGASDFIYFPRQQLSLFDRLKARMRSKQRLDILNSFASHDSLTGLPNRREFDLQFERMWRHSCRNQQELALILVDIDHFRGFNDHYGHPVGDDALVKVAITLKQTLFRGRDFIARIGGERFAILVDEMGEEGTTVIAERIHQAIAALQIKHKPSPVSSSLTVSLGIAWTRVHADNSLDLLYELAEDCLQQTKQRGRNQTASTILLAPVYEV